MKVVVPRNVRPVLVELWKRIEAGGISYIHTKTEACRLIGCALRWAEKIVADTANGSEASTRSEP